MPKAALAILLALVALPARAGDAPRVLADIAPVHAIAAAVMDGVGSPTMLVAGGADPHSIQLRPSEARRLAEAELIVTVGPELTPWLFDALEGIAPETPVVALLDAPGTIRREPMFGGHDHDHGDDADGHAHDHGGIDAHAWLDPMNAAAWAAAVAEALATADPANADAYAANADAFAGEMQTLVEDAAAILAPARDAAVIVQHDAYAHFAQRFDLTVAGSIADSDAVGPGTASLIRLEAHMQAGNIACLFTEAQQNTALAERLLEGTTVATATLDPLGAALEPGPGLYRAMILDLARAWAGCAAAG